MEVKRFKVQNTCDKQMELNERREAILIVPGEIYNVYLQGAILTTASVAGLSLTTASVAGLSLKIHK